MTIFEYMASANPNGAKNVINSFGKKANRNPEILAKQLAMCVNKHGQSALYQIALNHPDKALITECNMRENEKSEESPMSNAEGQELKKLIEDLTDNRRGYKAPTISDRESKKTSESTELFIIGAVAIVGLALILNK